MNTGFISMFMSITRTHKFRLQSAPMLSLNNHSTMEFVSGTMSCERTDLVVHLLLSHNDQHFCCIIQWFIIMLETDECASMVSAQDPATCSTNLIAKIHNEFSARVWDKQNSLVIILSRLVITVLPWMYFYIVPEVESCQFLC